MLRESGALRIATIANRDETMKPILTLFLLLWLTLPLAGQNAQDPDLDILLSLTSRTVRHDNSGSYILFTTDRDGEQKVYTQEILAIDRYNYLVRALHLGRYRYGVMDILGNLVVPIRYASVTKIQSGREWRQGEAERRRLEPAYQARYEQIRLIRSDREQRRQFAAMLGRLRQSWSAKCSETHPFRRGNGLLKRVRIGDRYGVTDSLDNLLLDVKYTEIRLIGTDTHQPYNRLFPVREEQTGTNYSFVDYIGDYVWQNQEIRLDDRLSWGRERGRDCYVYRDLTNDDSYYYVDKDRRSIDLDKFCTRFVTLNMENWIRKDEFESLEEYQLRQSTLYEQMAMEYYAQCAVALYLRLYPDVRPFELCEYDKDNGSFLIKSRIGHIAVAVPFEQSMEFRREWTQNRIRCQEIRFTASGEELTLSGISLRAPGRTYVGSRKVDYYAYNVETEGDRLVVRIRESTGEAAQQSTVTVPRSDVDVYIPSCYASDEKTFVVIISNENYTRLSTVPYALNDGETFRKYCNRTLGIPEANIRIYRDATFVEMRRAVSDVRELASVYQEPVRVIFYYSGHGAPYGSANEPYLLPVDAFGVDPVTCYSKRELYDELSRMNISSSIVFLDACFCGEGRDAKLLASTAGARAVKLIPRETAVPSKVVAFNATSQDETALPYAEKGHGMFTYFLLKKLQETSGDVTLGDLANYLRTQVMLYSKRVNDRLQVPTVSGEGIPDWENLKL